MWQLDFDGGNVAWFAMYGTKPIELNVQCAEMRALYLAPSGRKGPAVIDTDKLGVVQARRRGK